MGYHHEHHHTSPHIHHHGHPHHAPKDYGRAFIIGISLNCLFITIEIYFGIQANSVALLADAGHNASDVLGLLVAWGAFLLAKRKATPHYTYGLQGSSILAALANAILLLVAIGGIAWESLNRFYHPVSTTGTIVIAVAATGILINGITALLFLKGSKEDLNIRGAFLHMATDAAVSAGVVLSGFLMLYTNWLWLDPAISLFIGLVILIATWGLLRDAVQLSLHAVPSHIDYQQVQAFLASRQGVAQVHDLHIWALSTSETALSAHLIMRDGHPGDHFIQEIANELDAHYHIGHSTLQIEMGTKILNCLHSSSKCNPAQDAYQ